MMAPHDLGAYRSSASRLQIREDTTDEEACGHVLDELNGAIVGVVRFAGDTPWEWHGGDELVLVLEGRVRLTVLTESGPVESVIERDETFVVPARRWHRQSSEDACILYITPREGGVSPLDAGPPPSIDPLRAPSAR